MARILRAVKSAKDKTKKFGTEVTDFGKARERTTKLYETAKSMAPMGAFKDLDVEKQVEQFSRMNMPTLLADESAITKKKRKKISSDRLRSGRLSTILDDTLG